MIIAIKNVLVAFLLFAFFGSEAWGDVSIHAGGYSRHFFINNATNESHDFAAIQLDSYVVGRYNNSFGRETYFLAYEWNKPLLKNVEGFVWVGLTRGYTHCWKPYDENDGTSNVCPMFSTGVRYTKWSIQPSLMLVGDALSIEARYVF